jgi:dTDP-4-dehydrorhamnose reductase
MKSVLITGGNGYIAKSIYNQLKTKYQITTVTRSNFDLTNYYQTCEWFHEREYDVVIHTAITGGNRLVPETPKVVQDNIAMYNNLYANKHQFKKFISFGSGAEIFAPDSYYGASKITNSPFYSKNSGFYNLRVFATFDENELNTRFIKANIRRYINKEPIVVHTDKIMDFFYMKDLIELVDYYIQEESLHKTINCSYKQKFTLTNIADFINELDSYRVPIIIDNKNKLEFYCGESHYMPIKTIGLQSGIYNVYKMLCNGDLINA